MVLNTLEEYLKDKILPKLEEGRPNWDKPHTEAVVHYLKKIIDNSPDLDLDREVLLIAAYTHDWGYAGLFRDGKPLDYENVESVKQSHMEIGAKKVKELLKNSVFSGLSGGQKKRVIHLVKIHDSLNKLKDNDELVLMEADTLAGLDVEKVKPGFDKDSNDRYMAGVKKKRYSKFISEYAKGGFERLFKLRKEYYAKK